MNSVVDVKETDLEWIGSIPKHWGLKKIKYIFWERKENNNPIQSDNLISLTIEKGVIPHSEKTGGGNKPKEDLSKYKLVYPGDIVLNSMNVIAGAVGISKYFGVVSPVYYMLIPKNNEHLNEYFHHLFRTETFQKSLYGLGNGILIKENIETGKLNTIRMRIPMDKLGDQRIPVPPHEEQKLISRYLDKKTSQIDSLVEKIQKKIELLKEQRTSLINHYVTKGLDPNVEMKDSGIEWIGETPRHWEFTRNKNFLKLSKNIVGEEWTKHTLLSLGRSGVTVRDLESGKGKFPESFETYQTVKVGQFVFCLFDIDETPRTVGLSKEDGMITGAYTVFDCSNDVSADFIYYYYLTIDEFKGLAPHYSGLRKTIRPTKFLSLGMFLPSLQEQIEIVERIKKITKKIDKFIDLESNRKLVLNEYKQSLVSSVVTGKIRVTEDMI